MSEQRKQIAELYGRCIELRAEVLTLAPNEANPHDQSTLIRVWKQLGKAATGLDILSGEVPF